MPGRWRSAGRDHAGRALPDLALPDSAGQFDRRGEPGAHRRGGHRGRDGPHGRLRRTRLRPVDADGAHGRDRGVTRAEELARSSDLERRLRRQYLHAFVSAACVGPFLSYVLADAGWSPREIGWATALLTASAVATAPLWGLLDDRLGGGAARWSLLCTALASAVLTFSVLRWDVAATLAAVALLGSSSGSIEALLTSRALRDPRTAERLGATRSLGSIGWVLGLALGGVLLTVNSHAGFVFLLAGAAALT